MLTLQLAKHQHHTTSKCLICNKKCICILISTRFEEIGKVLEIVYVEFYSYKTNLMLLP